ncbi:interleukin-17F-like [Arapaima gigas]
MPSAFKTRTLMVFCMPFILGALMGSEGVPRHRVGKSANGKIQHEVEATPMMESVNLLLNTSAMSTTVQVADLSHRSLSPWTYNTIHDESLYPPFIAEARCLLTGCRNSASKEVMDLESRPIFHQVLVLRRVRGNGEKYVYKLETRSIAVGCTCVRPNVIEQ